MELTFEWHEAKAKENLRKHNVSFDQTKTVYNDPFLLTFPDEGHSQVEERFINMGRSSKGNILVVIHTERKKAIRIISSRKATATEWKVYEEGGGSGMSEKTNSDDMLPDYDFQNMPGGVRGKYYKAYRAGHTVKIHKDDGSVEMRHFTLEDGAVMIEPDIREYFPDSESVNRALRCLIPILSKKSQQIHARHNKGK